ncbi:hypothetical protein H2198_001250 [Neophaeococcomyces mojaviensis]|uniref:Uncharacterized protein n=1 Tax=Neophaeococcomyces mojaviensis TaxID=3383035 RepID=A0ACC3AHR8_9EURO|nr:hypothetical protein H2198_001250 [Knufia sp. JES_112]
MADSAIVPLLSYLGWSFLPNIGTNLLQNVYYRVTISAGQPHPQPGTGRYARDHRRIRVLVLCLYLVYTLAQSLYDVKLAGDFYTLLSVDPYRTSDKEIKSRLRRLAAKFHPDKMAAGTASSDETHFLQLRLASETLTTPSHRYAYTHFGPAIVIHLPKSDENSTKRALETATLVTIALKNKIPSYILTLLFVLALNTFVLPSRQSGKFWRYLIIFASFVLEFYLLTHDVPALPSILDSTIAFLRARTTLGNLLPPHLLPFQILQISTQLALSLNIFISQVSVLFPSAAILNSSSSPEQFRAWLAQLNQALVTLSTGTSRIDEEATGLLQLRFAPYKGQPEHVRELRRGMKEGMLMGVVRSNLEVQDAVRKALDRRKERKGATGHTSTALRHRAAEGGGRADGTDVVDLLNSDEQFI